MRETLEAFYERGAEVQKHFLEMAEDPMRYNRELLLRLLQDNKDTEFGKKYDFSTIDSIEEYQRRVPLSCYADYEDTIRRMTEDGETNIITSYPVTIYAKSSGTTGNPKRIPSTLASAKVSGDYLCSLKFKMVADAQGKDWFDGKCFFAIEKTFSTLPCGALYGPISGTMTKAFGDDCDDYFTSPKEVIEFDGKSDLTYLTTRFAIAESDVTEIVCTFATRMLDTFQYMRKNSELLIHDIETGTIDDSIRILPETKEALLNKIKPMPERAEELRKIFSNEDNTDLAKRLWPRLTYLQTIGTAGFTSYMEKLKKYIGDTKIFYIGLMASEGMFTYPLSLDSMESIPNPDFMFYEFLPVDSNDLADVKTIDQLEVGKVYETITTNLNGFYRYRMGDAVKVTGMYKNTPILEFLYRLNHNVSILGEKTGEDMLNDAIKATALKLDLDIVDYSAFDDKEAENPRYGFYIEIAANPRNISKDDIETTLDNELSRCNPSYKKYRDTELLSKLVLSYLQPETYLLLQDMLLYNGYSTAQIKPPHILGNEKKLKFLEALREN